MKLLIILAIEHHTKEVRKILREEGVPTYSETDIYGFDTEKNKPDISNWFSHNGGQRFSKLFFSFHTKEGVKRVLETVRKYNEKDDANENYPLHAFQLNVEDSA